MRSLQMLIGAGVLILLLAAILVGINAFRMTDYTESHDVTTGAGENTTDITLSQELFNAKTYNSSVTSNFTGDAPIPASYAEATQVLTVNGLQTSSQRRLTVVYSIDALDDYPGAGAAARVFPILLGLGAVGLIAGAINSAVRHND